MYNRCPSTVDQQTSVTYKKQSRTPRFDWISFVKQLKVR